MIDLVCPHCGGKLWINCEYVGRPYLAENTPESIECNDTCGATWEPDGTVRDEPNWIRYPDLYQPPTIV